MSALHAIAQSVRQRVEEDKARESLGTLLERARATPSPRNFELPFLAGDGYSVIAEIKRASPSEGRISTLADPVDQAKAYLAAGARAVSVLTERDHFSGSPDFLLEVRKNCPDALLLMKDFILDEYQLALARVLGADAVLLIVALVGAQGLRDFLPICRSHGLTALVEVHDEEELQIALGEGARLIGVNNRDLRTLKVSLSTSERLARLVPGNHDTILISESGLSERSQLIHLRELGYRGFLIGTALMKSPDPRQRLRELIGRDSP